MKFRLHSLVLLLTTAFALTFCLLSTASAQTPYDVAEIGTFGGSWTWISAINAYGKVTGYSATRGDSASRAFVGDPLHTNALTDLGTLGGTTSEGMAINASEEVAGYSTTADNSTHAFLYSGGTMKDLGTLGGTHSWGMGINASGQVVGYSDMPGNTVTHAFLYSGGTMKDLGTLGGSSSMAFAINDSGEVTGVASLPGDTSAHAFLYANGAMRDLGSLDGSPASQGQAINNFSQITGSAETRDFNYHAFLYSGGTMTDLTPTPPQTWSLGSGQGINNFGQVVGWSLQYNFHDVFLYTPGIGMATSYDLLGNPCDPFGDCGTWEGVTLTGINDMGQIAAANGFVLSPPASWFSAFQGKLQITGKGETHFHLTGSFSRFSADMSFDPLSQPVLLQIGSLPIAIQKGSFKQASNGEYVFQGIVGSAAVDFHISPVTNMSFTFKVQGRTGTPFRVTNPARFILMIGNNKTMGTLPWK